MMQKQDRIQFAKENQVTGLEFAAGVVRDMEIPEGLTQSQIKELISETILKVAYETSK